MANVVSKVLFHAVCKGQEDRPIVGWDEEGYALTVDWSRGQLIRAATLKGFSHLDDNSAKHGEVCGALPAPDGWRLMTSEGRMQPIVGWTVNGFGCGDPLVVDSNGTLIVANTQDATVYAPAQTGA